MSHPGPPVRGFAAALLFVALSFPGVARADDAPPAEEGDYQIEPATGHPFRVRFDPARRFTLGLGVAVEPLSDASFAPTLAAELGLSVRSIYSFGRGPGLILWNIEHRIVSGHIWPLRRASGAPAMDAALYSVALHRHDESPSAVLPVTPPLSVPFPFDIGFEGEAGRVAIPSALPEFAGSPGARAPLLRIGVLRATAFLDPLRSVIPGRSIEIGVGARYDVEPTAKAPSSGLGDVRMVHRIAPMTATSLRLRFQSENGLTVLDLRGDLIPHWTSELSWKIMALASARVQRTLLAINDEPIDIVVEGAYRRSPETKTTLVLDDVRVSLGLTFNVQIP